MKQNLMKYNNNLYGNAQELFLLLSPREMQILQYVTRGLCNKEIAFSLGISHQTVKNHMMAILHKLNIKDRTQAAVYALQYGGIYIRERLQDSKEEKGNF